MNVALPEDTVVVAGQVVTVSEVTTVTTGVPGTEEDSGATVGAGNVSLGNVDVSVLWPGDLVVGAIPGKDVVDSVTGGITSVEEVTLGETPLEEELSVEVAVEVCLVVMIAVDVLG